MATYSALNGKFIFALDFGTKVIGVASITVGRDPFPTPYGKIENRSEKYVLDQMRELISNEDAEFIVLGVPYLLDGKETKMTKKVQGFGQLLSKSFPDITVLEQDETLSTFEAKSRMKRGSKVDMKNIDSLSAAVILEDFLSYIKSRN